MPPQYPTRSSFEAVQENRGAWCRCIRANREANWHCSPTGCSQHLHCLDPPRLSSRRSLINLTTSACLFEMQHCSLFNFRNMNSVFIRSYLSTTGRSPITTSGPITNYLRLKKCSNHPYSPSTMRPPNDSNLSPTMKPQPSRKGPKTPTSKSTKASPQTLTPTQLELTTP